MTTATVENKVSEAVAPETWPRFRFAQRKFGKRWVVVPALEDRALAKRGLKLAGPIRDASNLDEADRNKLLALITAPRWDQTPEQAAEESILLAFCPYTEALPPIDLDVAPGATKDEVAEARAALTRAAKSQWAGARLAWARTGGRGYHVDLRASVSVASPLLLQAVGSLVRGLAQEAGVPLLSSFREKAGRPPVVVDDTLFQRVAASRGVQWRLMGSTREESGRRKSPVLPIEGQPDWTTVPTHLIAGELVRLEEAQKSVPTLAEARAAGAEARARNAVVQLRVAEGGLPTVAKLLHQHLPPSGKRHHYREAASGWLIRRGIPEATVAATIAAATGDRKDAEAAARSTTFRLQAGRNVYGIGKLTQLTSELVVDAFKAALEKDLCAGDVAVGRLDQFPSREDRKWLSSLIEPAYDAKKEKLAKAIKRAAHCGWTRESDRCKGCDRTFGTRHLAAENAVCPHCAFARGRDLHRWFAQKLPKRLHVTLARLPDDSLSTAQRFKAKAKKLTPKAAKPYVRMMIAPGWLAILAENDEGVSGAYELMWDRDITDSEFRAAWVNRHGALSMLNPLLFARAKRLKKWIATRDSKSMLEDGWATKVIESTAGVEARKALPWPSKKTLRELAKEASKQRRAELGLVEDVCRADGTSPCCGSKVWHDVVAPNGVIVCSRDDRRWRFPEACKQVRNYVKGTFGAGSTITQQRDGTVRYRPAPRPATPPRL